MTTKRRYDASGRRAAAEERRLRITAEAAELFAVRGWSGTTIAAVAEAADVSPDLVASAFGGKAGLLMAALRRVGFGAHANLQEAFAALHLENEPSREVRLEQIVGLACTALEAMAPIFSVLPLAADQDSELQGLVNASEAGLHGIAGEVIQFLAEGPVHPDTVDEVYVLFRSETYLALTRKCGWSNERYGAWLRRSLLAAVEPQTPVAGPAQVSR